MGQGIGIHHGQKVHLAAAPAGVQPVEGVDGGQQNQQAGFDQHGGAGGQGVVVAELDFIHGNGVVFIDDGDDAAFQEFQDAVAGIEVAAAVFQIVVGEQHLGDPALFADEQPVIGRHEAGLSDGGGHLERGEIGGFYLKRQGLEAAGDGPGGHHDDLAAVPAERRQAVHQLGHAAGVGPSVALDEHTAADFHDHAAGGGQLGSGGLVGHDGRESATSRAD